MHETETSKTTNNHRLKTQLNTRLTKQYQLERYRTDRKTSVSQGSYRNLTAVFQTFPGQNYFFSRLFEALCSSVCEHKHYRISLLHAEIPYTCILLFQIPNGRDSNFCNSELQMLCVMNCKKI